VHIRTSNLNGSASHPFVIPSEAEGSAVRLSAFPNSSGLSAEFSRRL
jgi:hypothetical protein